MNHGFHVEPESLTSFASRLHNAADQLSDSIAAAPRSPDTGKPETAKKLAHVFEALIMRAGVFSDNADDIADKVTGSLVCYITVEDEKKNSFGQIGE
jgi:hypothetical protein